MNTQADLKNRLDTRIAALEHKLDDMRAFRRSLDNAELADELAALFGSNGKPAASPELGLTRTPAFEKIEGFFRSRQNQPATRKEVITGTQLSKGTVTQIMYVSHKIAFDRKGPRKKQGQRETLFQLRQPVEEQKKPGNP